MEVRGARPRGRSRNTWWDDIKDVMKRFVLLWEDSQ